MKAREKLLERVLILRCQTGDESAFEELVERYHGRLYYYVRRLLGPNDRVDDVLQSVWLAVFRGLRKLRDPEAFAVWLYRIAHNRALQELRSSREVVGLQDDIPVTDAGQEEKFSPEDAASVHAALDRLRVEHREVLVLRFLGQLSYQEIAAVVGCSLGTVKSRIYHAKRALRRLMEEMSDEG